MEEALGRHHRTALLLSALGELRPQQAAALLQELHFGVAIERADALTRPGQAALLTAINVLARSSGAVSLQVPAVPLLLPGLPWSGTLDEVAHAVALWAGARVLGDAPVAGVQIGQPRANEFVAVAGNAWTAYVDDPDSRFADSPLTFGAIAAAHLGSARAFHLAVGKRLSLPPLSRSRTSLSLWYGPSTPPRALRPLHGFILVGAGAVGDALVWALVLGGSEVADDVTIFDPQTIDATNLNRHLVAGIRDVGVPKAAIARDFIATRAPRTIARVERFMSSGSGGERLISTVDNDETRYQLQATFPRRLYHGATTHEQVGVGVFDFTDGACLGCLFPRPHVSQAQLIAQESGIELALVSMTLARNGPFTEDMLPPVAKRLGVSAESLRSLVGRSLREVYARELCGRLPTGKGLDAPAATIAHASGLAGVLLAAELAKDDAGDEGHGRLRNYIQLASTRPADAWVTFREKQEDCPLMCGSDALQNVVRALRTERV